MSFSLVSNTIKGTNSGGATTAGIDTTGANLIVISVGSARVTLTISDSKGNTWIKCPTIGQISSGGSITYYCFNPAVGSGHTFTVSGTACFSAISVHAFSGAGGTVGPQNGLSATTGGGASLSPGDVIPDYDNCLVMSTVTHGGTSTSCNGGFTAQSINISGGNYFALGAAYLIQTTAAAANPQWTWTTSSENAGSNIVFNPTVSSGGLRRNPSLNGGMI